MEPLLLLVLTVELPMSPVRADVSYPAGPRFGYISTTVCPQVACLLLHDIRDVWVTLRDCERQCVTIRTRKKHARRRPDPRTTRHPARAPPNGPNWSVRERRKGLVSSPGAQPGLSPVRADYEPAAQARESKPWLALPAGNERRARYTLPTGCPHVDYTLPAGCDGKIGVFRGQCASVGDGGSQWVAGKKGAPVRGCGAEPMP